MLLRVFIVAVLLFLSRLPHLLLSLVILEVLSFLVIFILGPLLSSGFVIIILFSVFVFLAVIGVISFYTLLVSSGSDFVCSSTSVRFNLCGARLIRL